jgi:hypothetical protein
LSGVLQVLAHLAATNNTQSNSTEVE